MRRKETWATTGPRIKVRFFGGFGMDSVTPGNKNWVEAAYANGVSMGGALNAPDAKRPPTFAVWAIKDSESGNLDRIQIVKGWSENGESHEQVYNAVWSGDRKIDSATGELPAVGNSVDLKTAAYTNSIGAVELMGMWTDPDFNAQQNAFYYVRVLEIPTPRWSLYDEVRLGKPFPDDLPKTIQERAFTSPIWYDNRPANSPVAAAPGKELMMAYLDRSEEQTQTFRDLNIEGPILMLNMLRFKKEGGREKYREYAERNATLLAKVGGKLVSRWDSRVTLVGGEEWDSIAVVEYPSREAFLEMALSEEFQQTKLLRKDALEDSRLVCMQASDLKPTP